MYTFQTITSKDITCITTLLKERQMDEIKYNPSINQQATGESYLKDCLSNLLSKNSLGVVAYDKQNIVGYLIAEFKEFSSRGKYAWVPYEGLAISKTHTKELIRHMYKYAAQLWIEKGYYHHSIHIPLGNPIYLDALMHLSFAIEQVYALLNLQDFTPYNQTTSTQTRLINDNDAPILGEMSSIISKYQSQSPSFSPVSNTMISKIKQAFEHLIYEDDVIVFLAEEKGKTLGFFEYEFVLPNLMIPDKCIELCTAGVLKMERSKGIGKTLMNNSIAYLKTLNYQYVTTDWKVTNLAASQFYPKSNFTPTAYRMHRTIQTTISEKKSC